MKPKAPLCHYIGKWHSLVCQLDNGIVGTKTKHEPEDRQDPGDILTRALWTGSRSRPQMLEQPTLALGLVSAIRKTVTTIQNLLETSVSASCLAFLAGF